MRNKRVRRVGQVALSALFVVALVPLARPVGLAILGADGLVQRVAGWVYGAPPGPTPPTDAASRYTLSQAALSGTVEPRFLSFAIDTSEVVGGRWWSPDGRVELLVGSNRVAPFDFARPQLSRLAAALAPAYLRVGGTEADNIAYEMGPDATAADAAHNGTTTPVLHRGQWHALHRFADRAGLSVMFTANAGPAARDAQGRWRPEHLEPLLRHSAAAGLSVPVWELGNEVNAFAVTHGLGARVSARRYAEDVKTFAGTVRKHFPKARVAAGAVFAWPVMGETPGGFSEDFLSLGGGAADVFTWHFYPQQSRRCLTATRRASPTRLLEPGFLNEFQGLASHFGELARHRTGSAAPAVWVGETGNAQCGGEPGVSDRFASSLWWLDQLGSAARAGQQVVVRQTLAGSHYGLLEPATLRPRPDYWASLLWKRHMGPAVVNLPSSRDNPHLRVYAHCHPNGDGRLSVLAINLRADRSLSLRLAATEEGTNAGKNAGTNAALPGRVFAISAQGLQAEQVRLNRKPLRIQRDGTLPELAASVGPVAEVPVAPLSYAFVIPDAPQAVCQGPQAQLR